MNIEKISENVFYSTPYSAFLMFIANIRAGRVEHIELNTNKDILFQSNK